LFFFFFFSFNLFFLLVLVTSLFSKFSINALSQRSLSTLYLWSALYK